jgi:ketosteroid isomerase-like protein
VIHTDRPTLTELLADDIRVVHATDRVDGKAGIIDVLSHLRFQSYTRDDVDIRISGDTALLFATTHKTYRSQAGTVVDEDATLVAYERRGGRWLIVALQNTPVRRDR